MADICLTLLDMSHKHKQDPVKDASARRDPVYVSRVVSAMVGRGGGGLAVDGRLSSNRRLSPVDQQ